MSESTTDRVSRLLEETEGTIDELSLESEDLEPIEESGLLETAEEANELIEEGETAEILEALGLDELEDGTEPGSLPEAIARGSEERIGDLQVLVKLAKVAGADDDELVGEVGELREAVDDRVGVVGEDGEDEAEEGGSEDDESLAESAADAVRDAVGDEEGEGGEDEEGFLEEEIKSSMRSRLEGFGEEVEDARDRLDSLRDEEEAAEDEEEVDEDVEEAAEDEEDSSSLGSDSRPRSRGTMHSTMAPSPSNRADMGRSTRHSTMPDR